MQTSLYHRVGLGGFGALALCLASLFAATPPPLPDQNTSEPRVTPVEAQLLAKAEQLAGSDAFAAVSLLQGAVKQQASAALLFSLGAYQTQTNDLPGAIASFADAVKILPDFRRARLNLAKLLMQSEQYAAALPHLQRLLAASAGKPDAPAAANLGKLWSLTGYCLLATRHATAAEAAYRNALVYQPDNSDTRLGLIQSLLSQENQRAARPLLREELAKNPHQGDLWKLLANAELKNERSDEALKLLECARQLGLADKGMILSIADLYLDRGMAEPALAAYQEVAAFQNASPERLLRGIDALLRLGHLQNASELIQTLEKSPLSLNEEQTVTLRILQARLAQGQDQPASARKIYLGLLEANPLNGKILLALGDLARDQKQFSQALIYYERAEPLPHYKVRALIGQAQVAVEQERFPQAAALLEQSLQLEESPHIRQYLQQIRRLSPAISSPAEIPSRP
jgi:tetratricopeptide (TPR) repeat protein